MDRIDFSKWVDEVINTSYTYGINRLLNTIDKDVIKEIEQKGIKLDGKVYITDKRIKHTIRDNKKKENPDIVLTEQELKYMFDIVNKPDKILIEKAETRGNIGKERFLFIKELADDISIKLIIEKKLDKDYLTYITASKIKTIKGKVLNGYNVIYKKPL